MKTMIFAPLPEAFRFGRDEQGQQGQGLWLRIVMFGINFAIFSFVAFLFWRMI